MASPTNETCRLEIGRSGEGTAILSLLGNWTFRNDLPESKDIEKRLQAGAPVKRIAFHSSELRHWDSGLLTFVLGLVNQGKERNIDVDLTGLPQGVRGLVELASEIPEEKGTHKDIPRPSFLTMVGRSAIDFSQGTGQLMAFIGEATLSFGRFVRGQARFRRSDLWGFIQQAGIDALPIVSLISLLQGLTMAFLGAAQLSLFGAQIYVANLIGLSMVAEIGAVMTAIIMAGRTGAAYAAQIGTMQVNQEIDALTTLGLKPMDFLVLPRMIALIIMMPLLYLYANLLGMIGGGIIAVSVLDLTSQQYLNQLFNAVPLSLFGTGLLKSAVFGLLVAMCGCMQGMACGRSASAVGQATTSAVVMSIVAIIVADGVFGVINPPLAMGM